MLEIQGVKRSMPRPKENIPKKLKSVLTQIILPSEENEIKRMGLCTSERETKWATMHSWNFVSLQYNVVLSLRIYVDIHAKLIAQRNLKSHCFQPGNDSRKTNPFCPSFLGRPWLLRMVEVSTFGSMWTSTRRHARSANACRPVLLHRLDRARS